MQTAVRCYKYALRPTPPQWQAIAHAQRQARRLWNEMVALLRWAEKEQRNGRREALLHEYGRILAGKNVAGVALVQARRLVQEGKFTTVETACAASRAAKAEEARKWGRRRLALAYAVERTQATARGKRLTLSAQTIVAVVRKFGDACALYVTGQRGAPHFKVKGDPVSLQRQVSAGAVAPVNFEDGTADLATLLGHESCHSVPAILHRPLPAGATIKQVALTATATRAFVVLMVEAPTASFLCVVPEVDPAAVAGIDPGRKTALTVASVDGATAFTIQPPLFRDARFLRRQNRLLRRADRQLRQANPERFDEKGRWKRGGRRGPVVVTKGLQQTRSRIAEAQRHVADARREAYHLGANRLLAEFAVVGVGNWRGKGKAPGVGKSRRAQNRKDYDNAISEFTAILKDKAARCTEPRRVFDVREAGTTRNCPDCGEPTGPRGLKDLKVREWTCPNCGQAHQRDFASARAIARRAQQTAAGAHPAQPEPRGSKPAVASTKVRVREGRAKSPLPRKKASGSERRSGASVAGPARAGKAAGGGVVAKLARCSQPPIHRQMELPLANPDAPQTRAATYDKTVPPAA